MLDQIVKLRDLEKVTSIVATHQMRDAFYLASHVAEGPEGTIRELSEAEGERASFMVLHEGRIYFEGSGAELRNSQDEYLKEFMFLTLPPW